jgi:hypothetical protein
MIYLRVFGFTIIETVDDICRYKINLFNGFIGLRLRLRWKCKEDTYYNHPHDPGVHDDKYGILYIGGWKVIEK